MIMVAVLSISRNQPYKSPDGVFLLLIMAVVLVLLLRRPSFSFFLVIVVMVVLLIIHRDLAAAWFLLLPGYCLLLLLTDHQMAKAKLKIVQKKLYFRFISVSDIPVWAYDAWKDYYFGK